MAVPHFPYPALDLNKKIERIFSVATILDPTSVSHLGSMPHIGLFTIARHTGYYDWPILGSMPGGKGRLTF